MSKLTISSRYGVVPNEILNHKEISLKAKGLYGFLQGKPDNWTFSTERIASQIKENEKSIRKTLQELEKFRLLTRENKPKDKQGKWTGYNYMLQPSLPKPSLPKAVGRKSGITVLGEDISKQDYSKQDIVNNIDIAKQSFAEADVIPTKKILKEPLKEHLQEIQKILDIFYRVNPTLNFGNNTQRKAALELVKKFGAEKTINTAEFATSIHGKRYAPVITTPLELKNNMGKLLAYYKREQEPVRGVMPIFNL